MIAKTQETRLLFFFNLTNQYLFKLYHFFLYILQISLFGDFVPSKYNAATPIFIMLYELQVRHTSVYSKLHNFPCTTNIKFLSENEFIVRVILGLFLFNVIFPEIEQVCACVCQHHLNKLEPSYLEMFLEVMKYSKISLA